MLRPSFPGRRYRHADVLEYVLYGTAPTEETVAGYGNPRTAVRHVPARIHGRLRPSLSAVTLQYSTGLSLKDADKIDGLHVSFVLFALSLRKFAFVAFVA